MEQKKKRAPNYNTNEKEVLLSLVEKYKKLVENKKTDSVTVSEKTQAWLKITEEFNSVTPNNVFRPTESLKKFFENIKEDLRKRAGEERKSIYKTGGGSGCSKWKESDELLLSVINNKTVFGLENSFDNDTVEPCTSQFLPHMETVVNCPTGDNIEIIYEEPVADLDKDKSSVIPPSEGNEHNWSQIKPDHLKRPLSAPLKRKIAMISDKQHKKKPVGLGSSNVTSRSAGRYNTIRTLTSSKLGEKYEKLIEKKMDLADCLKKEHILRMTLLNFDKALKRKELIAVRYTAKEIDQLESLSCDLGV